MKIRRIKRQEIDEKKWDDCINNAANGHVFAQSWYLDIVCDDWAAIVLDDYQAILPLPLSRILFVDSVYNPYWCAYLGIINKVPISDDKVHEMIKSVPYWNIHMVLGTHNRFANTSSLKQQYKTYTILDLIGEFNRLKQQLSPVLKSSVDAYNEQELVVVRTLNAADYIKFIQHNHVFSEQKESGTLLKLISFAMRYKSAGLYAAYSDRNELLAGAFILKSDKKLSFIHCADTNADYWAVKAIVYHVLKNNAGSNLTLEFPFYSELIGKCFSPDEHRCMIYKKGLPKWISLY